MPGENDIQLLRAFVQETLRTYEIVTADGRTARVVERELLRSALLEFTSEGQPERLVSQYAGTADERLRDAGLLGEQLRSKRELARLASADLLGDQETARPEPEAVLAATNPALDQAFQGSGGEFEGADPRSRSAQ